MYGYRISDFAPGFIIVDVLEIPCGNRVYSVNCCYSNMEGIFRAGRWNCSIFN